MKSPADSPRVARFGAFEVDLRASELRKHGIRIKVQDQPFRILELLLAKPGAVVTREELRQKLWPADTFVDFDHGLNNAIQRLREALGDSADSSRYVKTVPRQGYRLIVPVEEVGGGVDGAPNVREASNSGALEAAAPHESVPVKEPPHVKSGPRQPVWRYQIVLSAAAMVVGVLLLLATNPGGLRDRLWQRHSPLPIQSIAVLPLENLSGDPSQEFFTDGMTDALITDLAKIGSLKVISRISAMQYKNTKKPLPQIARELHVDAVIEGTVVRSGSRVRINAQLIQAATDRHMWASSYDRSPYDVVALQNEVARDIADQIQIKLTPQERSRLSSERAVNPEAYEDYLQGLYLFNKQLTRETFKRVVEYMQRAIDKDPGYAVAYARLADGYTVLGMDGGLPPREAMPKAKILAQKALAMDDALGEAHSSLAAVLYYYEWDRPAAEREFTRAIQLNPGYAMARVWYSRYLWDLGRFDEAIAEAHRPQELDPLSLLVNWNVATVLYFARQYDRALEQCRQVLEMDPNYERAHYLLANIYELTGRYQQAVSEYQRRAELSPNRLWDLSMLARAYAFSGDKAKARKLLAQALQQNVSEGDLHAQILASVYAAVGDKDEALKWLEKAYENRDWSLLRLKVAPQWDPLRSDPRFQDLVRRVGLPP